MKFRSLEPQTEPVHFDDMPDRDFRLTEADPGAAARYQDARLAIFDAAGEGNRASLAAFVEIDRQLVSDCLQEKNCEGWKQASSAAIVAALPDRVLRQMTSWVLEHSDLDTPFSVEAMEKAVAKLQERIERARQADADRKN